MITTISLNPSIDRTVQCRKIRARRAEPRASSAHSVAAGKGINVALTASALGVATRNASVLCIAEGSKLFEKRLMVGSALNTISSGATAAVRTNVKVFDQSTGTRLPRSTSPARAVREDAAEAV